MNLKFFISTGSFIFCFLILSVKSDESEEENVDIISLKPEHVDQNWKTFKAKHNRRYKNKTHESTKRAVFEKNLKIINDLNTQYKNGKISYKAGINRFSDMTKEEFRAFVNKGTNRPNTKYSNSINYTTIDIGQLKSLPASIDWRKNGAVSPVKNQGNCGSCWAFSAVCSLEGQYFKVNKKLVQLSEQNLVDCTYDSSRDGCQGGWPTEAFDYVKTNNGIDINSQYPYVSGFNAISGSCKYESGAKSGAKVTGFKVVTDGKRNINAVKNALATVGPVSAALLVTDNFMHYKGGIFSDSRCTGSDTPNHAIALVGYGTDSKRRDYFILRNSWSENWGEKGYMRISQNNNMCSISSYVSYPILSKSQISTTPATSTTSRNNQVYNQIPSSDTGGQNDFNFSISNDQSYDLKLFWIDWNHSFILYSVIPSGGQYRQLSFYNHAWVLANNENKKCLVFKLGQTNLFTVSDQTIKVSDMTGDECNPNDVQY